MKSQALLSLYAAAVMAIKPIEIKGTHMFEYGTGKPFQVRGVDYYPRPNAGLLDVNNHDFFTDDYQDVWENHIKEFIALGVNAVRLYAVDPSKSHDKFMCALTGAGIYVLVDLASSCENCAITSDPYPACYPAALKTRGQQIITAFSKYNNVLGFSAGNEVNHVVTNMNTNAPCQKKFIRDMRAFVSSCASKMRSIPVGVVLADTDRGPNALYYGCRTNPNDVLENVEWYGLNAYLQCDPLASLNPTVVGAGYRNLLTDFQSYKLPFPSLLTEYGCLNSGFPTKQGYAAQRTWLDAGWLLSSTFSDVFAGGFAFEFSTENANSKADSPYPFTSFGTQNYGLGYFSPATCDSTSTPCKFNHMPNFEDLATQYLNTNTTAALPVKSAYTPTITSFPACPAGVPGLSGVTWPSDSQTDMLCPDLTQTPLCPGDVINTATGTTLPPSTVTVSPVPNVPTVTPASTGGSQGSAGYQSASTVASVSATVVVAIALLVV
ncbi:hypothetical protein AC1031_019593 [Aphanomyces cochlioides]|nr:hypothetical protein AC1031_019593 [Aphanomyces cochlioides]